MSDWESQGIRLYMDLLRESEAHRAKSTYFFIAINVALLLPATVLPAFLPVGRSLLLLLPVLGMFLAIYWVYEQRESHILHEVRFRTMLELEKKYLGGGLLEKEWERLGDYPMRRSPVFFVALSRGLPLVFLMAHFAVIVALVIPKPHIAN